MRAVSFFLSMLLLAWMAALGTAWLQRHTRSGRCVAPSSLFASTASRSPAESRTSAFEESAYDDHLRLLLFYKELNGHMDVPWDFFVPYNLKWPTWSEKFFTLRLGRVVSDIRQGKLHNDSMRSSWLRAWTFTCSMVTAGAL